MLETVGRVNVFRTLAPGYAPRIPGLALLVGALLATSAVAAWASPPELVKAALALPAVAVLPVLVGLPFVRLSLRAGDPRGLDVFGRTLVAWLLGSVALVAIAVALQLGGQAWLLRHFGLLALALALGGAVAGAPVFQPARFELRRPATVALGAAVLVSLAPKLIAARFTPFPLISSNFLDPLYFSQPALRLAEHGYGELNTGAHAPGVMTLTSVSSQLYDVDPLSILWMTPFMLYGVFGAGLFLWARAVWRRWTSALLVSAVGLFILTGYTAFQATPLFFRSNTVLLALFPMALYLVHRLVADGGASPRAKIEGLLALQVTIVLLFGTMNAYDFGVFAQEDRVLWMLAVAVAAGIPLLAINRNRWRWDGFLPLFAVIVGFQVFHVFEGPVFLTALVIYGLATALRGTRAETWVAVGCPLLALGYFFLLYSGAVSFPKDFSLASSLVFGDTYNQAPFSYELRLFVIQRAIGPLLIALLVLGTAGSLIRTSQFPGRAVVIVASLMFVVYFLPDARALRTNRVLVPFLALLVVAGADAFGMLARQAVGWLRRDVPLVQEALQLGLVAAALPWMIMPFVEFNSTVPEGQTSHSAISTIEYEVADWFRENTGENVRIISDYQTMLVVSSLSNKVSLTERKLFAFEMSQDGQDQMRIIKEAVLGAPKSQAAHSSIQLLAGSEPSKEKRYLEASGMAPGEPRYYVVWTGQTCVWARREGIRPVRRFPSPTYVTPSVVSSFDDPRYFRKVAQFADQAYIFEVLPEPAGQVSSLEPAPVEEPSASLVPEPRPQADCIRSP